MQNKKMKVSLDQFVKFLKHHVNQQQAEKDSDDSESVLDDSDDDYVVDFGSGPKLETSPTSSLIRSWQDLCGGADD
ncbi:MAG: hypothetical protein HUJ26_02135 [Planctomycetaceae bacterium]|nr:hypothetical protein [Planctomycetaceae bacterium]